MIAAFGLGLVAVVLRQTQRGADSGQSPPAAAAPPAAPAAAAPAESTTSASKSWNFKTRASVKTIACSEDGKLVAVANGDPTMTMLENGTSQVRGDRKPSAEILDSRTGKTVAVLKLTTAAEDAVLGATPRFEVTALAFSPDGKVVAVGTSIGQIKLYDTRTGEGLRLLDDRAGTLADKKTLENLKSIARAMGSVASLAFSPDGRQLATCGGSFGDFSRVLEKSDRLDERSTGPGRLKIWDVKTETLKHDLVGHSRACAIAYSPDGSLLASAGSWLSDDETGTGVVIWNAQSLTKIRTVSIEANGGTDSVAFSLDGKLMAISSRHFDKDNASDPGASIISLANVASGIVEWQRTLPGWAKPVAFQSNAVVVLNGGQLMPFLELKTGRTLFRIKRSADPGDGGRWNDFAFAKRGDMWVIGGEDADRKGTVEVIDPDA
jgi:WD40 repeat protein